VIAQRPFQTFLTRAHRRRVVWRVIEHATIGLLVSCGVAAMILAIAWWQAIDAIAPVIAIMLIGIVAGIVASIWRRPTLLDTAGLIETQLNASELISSALLTAHAEFASALYAMADARVAGVTLTSLALRRLGSRTFLSAGLASICVLILGMMITSPVVERTAVAGDASNSADRWVNQRESARIESPPRDTSEPTRPIQRDPDSPSASRSHDASASLHDNKSRDASSNNSDASSTGSGAAQSNDASVRLVDSNRTTATVANSGTLAAVGNGSAANASRNGLNSSGVVNNSHSPQSIAPWQSNTWTNDRDAALQAIQNGSVPDSYRSLVQDYFERR
jgi:hypothetical protein